MSELLEPIIGIDLGTTRCCVGTWRQGRIEIIPNDIGDRTTPSIVSFTKNQTVIGEPARSKMIRNLENTIYDSKRLIGRLFNDPVLKEDKQFWSFHLEENENTKKPQYIINLGDNEIRKYYPEEISGIILRSLKTFSSNYLGKEVKKAVITVPAYFNNEQRQATKEAAKNAELEVIKIINEPTAAAIAYGLQNESKEEKIVLIFDLGGGTFDVSILKIKEKKFEVLSSCGDSHLGGEDFTLKLSEFIIEKMLDEFEKKIDVTKSISDNVDKKTFYRVRNAAEKAKQQLSFLEESEIDLDGILNGEDFFYKITKTEYEGLCIDLFKKCLNSIEKAIQDANIKKTDINDIVLAGGSSRTPRIQKMIKDYFGKELKVTINPDEAIAYGATTAAYVETSFKEIEKNDDTNLEKIEIIDKITFPIGIEVDEGKMIPLIPKSTKLPEKGKTRLFSKTFMPKNDYGKGFIVNVYEGESELVKENHLLGKYTVTGIPFDKRENIIVRINLYIDHDSIVTLVVRTNDVENKKITIAKEHMYNEEDMKRFKENMEDFIEKDKIRKLVSKDLNDIVNLNNELKKNITSSELGDDDKNIIKKKCSEIEKWIQKNKEPTKEECENKIKEISDFNKQYF